MGDGACSGVGDGNSDAIGDGIGGATGGGVGGDIGGAGAAAVVESANPGCEIKVVRAGVPPRRQMQSGSPSSTPLDWPSPSESAWHSATVHSWFSAAKALPKGFVLPPPERALCPTPNHVLP